MGTLYALAAGQQGQRYQCEKSRDTKNYYKLKWKERGTLVVKLNKKVTVQVEAKILEICARPSDAGCYTLYDQGGNKIHFVDGYVPWWIGGGCDYIEMKIDIETGQILDWKVPSASQIEEWMSEET